MVNPSTATSLRTTPEFTLIRLREHCQRILKASAQFSTAAVMAAQMFLALDSALTDDGVLPLDWSGASRSMVVNGLPKQPTFTGFLVPDILTDDDEEPEEFLEV